MSSGEQFVNGTSGPLCGFYSTVGHDSPPNMPL